MLNATNFSGHSTTIRQIFAECGPKATQRLGVSLCSEDGYCHVYLTVNSFEEALAAAAASRWPLAQVALVESYGQQYTIRQGMVVWSAWTFRKA